MPLCLDTGTPFLTDPPVYCLIRMYETFAVYVSLDIASPTDGHSKLKSLVRFSGTISPKQEWHAFATTYYFLSRPRISHICFVSQPWHVSGIHAS